MKQEEEIFYRKFSHMLASHSIDFDIFIFVMNTEATHKQKIRKFKDLQMFYTSGLFVHFLCTILHRYVNWVPLRIPV